MTAPAQAQQGTLFICGAPEVVGSPSVTEIGGVDVSECSDVLGLSSGLEVELGSGPRDRGRPTCDQVEVLKSLDAASPAYLDPRRSRDLSFSASTSCSSARITRSALSEQLFELSLRQSFDRRGLAGGWSTIR